MIRLAEKYFDRPAAELPLLFQRILSNATMDWFRRQKVRNAVVSNFSEFEPAAATATSISSSRSRRWAGRSASESASDSVSRAQILQLDRRRSRPAAGPSTRSVSPALLGGTRCRRDRRLDGVFGRERQDALLARRARLGEGSQGKGNRTMNQLDTSSRSARDAMEARFARRIAACLSESARSVAPGLRAPALRAREGAQRGALARSGVDPRRRDHRFGAAIARLQPVAVVAPFRLGPAAGALLGGLVLIQDWQTRRRSRSLPKSTRPCWATTCPSTPTATPASPSS